MSDTRRKVSSRVWTGAKAVLGPVTAIVALAVAGAADAEASCPASLNLSNDIVSGVKIESACGPIIVGPNYTILPTGTLHLQTTDLVGLGNGFTVQDGGVLRVGTAGGGNFVGFPNGGGSIPDDDENGLDLLFNVTGLGANVKRVRVSLTLNHGRVGDLTATLTAPFGVAKLVLFGRPGHRPTGTFGTTSDFDGTYVFDDFSLESLWSAIADLGGTVAVPPGTYRTSTAAPFGDSGVISNAGGCSTYLSGAFAGLTAFQANGTWTLEVKDSLLGQTGTVSSATLEIETGSSPPNRISGFVYPGECTPAPFDMTGTGRTSYSFVTNDSDFLRWHVIGNDGSAAGQPEQTFIVGRSATDFWLPADFDGDGIADAGTWGPDPDPPNEYRMSILRSSRPNDILLELPLGMIGDNPTVYGDFDGDRVIDPGVFRGGQNQGDDHIFEFLPSTEGGHVVRSFVLGQLGPGLALPYPSGDVTGDGIHDITVVEGASWTVFDGSTGNQVGLPFTFGLATDAVLVPGHFVGNPFGDYTRVFVDGADVKWQSRDGQTGVAGPEIIQGAVGIAGFAEFAVAGDYDGDGLMDKATWRRDDSPKGTPCTPDVTGTRFIIRQSSDNMEVEFCYGASGGSPVPGANSQ